MMRLYWQLKHWTGRRSREGVIGLLMITIGILFDLIVLAPAYSHIQQLHQLATAHDSLANTRTLPVHHEPNTTEQLNTYYSYFPSEKTTPDWLSKIYDAAKLQHLQLTEGEYRIQRVESVKIIRYHIAIPVEGSYSQIRHFISRVLSNVPIASLDHISFERKKIEDQTIDAKITFTLYMAAAS